MILNFLLNNFYLSAVVISVLYVSDYLFTYKFSELYQKGARKFFEVEGGVELNPLYRRDVDKLKKINLKFFVVLIGLNVAFFFSWYTSVVLNKTTNPFEFVLGAFILAEFFIHTRHFKNYYQAKATFKMGNVEGHIKYFRTFMHKAAAVDALVFAAIYFILWLFVGRQFFLGGAFICFLLTLIQKFWLKNFQKDK